LDKSIAKENIRYIMKLGVSRRQSMAIRVKRVYEKKDKNDGYRILVDRLWPRGLSKEKAGIDLWLKDISPSDALRKWFSHDEAKWNEFKQKYYDELTDKQDLLNLIFTKVKVEDVTLLYSAKNEKFNNAVALKEYVERTKA